MPILNIGKQQRSNMENSFFRELDETEEQEFRQWARDNHKPGDIVSPVWHPVVRDEIQQMADEAKNNQSKRGDFGE